MKTLFTTLGFVLFSLSGQTQTCGTIVSQSVVPNPAIETDSAWLNLQVYCNVNAWLDSYTVTPSGNNFMINAYYCQGMLMVITTTNDSIPLGILPAGNYTYTVNVFTSGDCINFTTTDQDAGNFVVDPVGGTGISSVSENDFSVFPNPFTDKIEIQFSENAGKEFSIQLSEINGKIISVQPSFENGKQTINTSSLGNGMYFLTVTSGDKKSIRKIIK